MSTHQESDSTGANEHATTDHQPSQKSSSARNQPSHWQRVIRAYCERVFRGLNVGGCYVLLLCLSIKVCAESPCGYHCVQLGISNAVRTEGRYILPMIHAAATTNRKKGWFKVSQRSKKTR